MKYAQRWGEEPPSVLKIESISRVRLAVYPEEYWSAVEVDPIAETIVYIDRVLWRGLDKKAERLSEARKVYEIAKFFAEKGYRFSDEHVVEAYKDLVELFEKKYRFRVVVELTVHKEELVPGWDELVEQLAGFFYERGLLAKIYWGEDGGLESVFRKPLP